jgi:hypothetical protein
MNTKTLSTHVGPEQASLGIPDQRNRRLLAQAVVMFVTILACLAMLEVGLRMTHRYPMGNTEGYFAQGGISYLLKKNITKDVFWPSMSFTVHTSDLGFRSPKPGPQHIGEQPYYAVLGASDAFGNGLDYEKTFVGIFAERLKQHNIDVVNLAVAGHHLQEQAALFKSLTASVINPPQAVVIVFNPLLIGGYDDNHPNVVVRRGDLFEGDNWRMALTRKLLANTSASYCFFRDGIRRTQQKFFGREDFSLSFYVERFSSTHRIRQPEKTADFLKNLREFEQFIRSLNGTPICVYCPPAGVFQVNDLAAKGKLDPRLIDTEFFVDIVRTHCKAEGVKFVDLTPPVQERFNKGEKLNFDADGHYNGPTSRVVGEYLYGALQPEQPNGKK